MMTDGRGFGIGVVNVKNACNVSTLLRAAYNFGAAFVFTIGERYRKTPTDTSNYSGTVPMFRCASFGDLRRHIPYAWMPVCVELCDDSQPLVSWSHPKNAVYILGPEDGSVPKAVQTLCPVTVSIPTRRCMNVAMAGVVVMYDRIAKDTLRKLKS